MTRYRVYTAVSVTVYIEDGKVTGIDAEPGWHEPDIEAEDENEDNRDVPISSDEGGDVLDVLKGKWIVREDDGS